MTVLTNILLSITGTRIRKKIHKIKFVPKYGIGTYSDGGTLRLKNCSKPNSPVTMVTVFTNEIPTLENEEVYKNHNVITLPQMHVVKTYCLVLLTTNNHYIDGFLFLMRSV